MIFAKNPTEKFLGAQKKGRILAKMLKIGHFGPFLTQKTALVQKIGAFAPIFLHYPMCYHDTRKVNHFRGHFDINNFSVQHDLIPGGC